MSPNGFVDDLLIGNETVLWRGITPPWQINDLQTGEMRASSAAFKTDQLSVHIAGETTVEQVLAQLPPGSRLQRFTAGDVRAVGCIIVRDPSPPNLASHALVLRGDAPGKNLRQGQAKQLQRCAQWVDL